MNKILAIGIATLLLGLVFNLAIGVENGQHSGQDMYDVGPFRVRVSFNETLYEDKLKISKTEFNVNYELHGLPLTTMTMKRKEFLTKCANLDIQRPEAMEDIDCRPLVDHLAGGVNQDSSAQADYVKQSIYKLKRSILKHLSTQSMWFDVFPLKPSVVKTKLAAVAKRLGLEDVGFVDSAGQFGFYLDFNTPHEVNHMDHCSGYILASMNETDDQILYSTDPAPGFSLAFVNFIDVARDGGAIISLDDLRCRSTKPGDDQILRTEFSMFIRKTFPYFGLSHKVWTEPDEDLLNYTATIHQTNHPTGENPSDESYSTMTEIKSISSKIDWLNMMLEQTTRNDNSTDGYETMLLAVPHYGSMIVKSEWGQDKTFTKSMRLGWYPLGVKSAKEETFPEMLNVTYIDLGANSITVLNINKAKIRAAAIERIISDFKQAQPTLVDYLDSFRINSRDEL